jgi:uncharacterized LabA/DUF88 family protein
VASKSLKTYVYVDGFDLYYGALRKSPYKWLDLAKFCQRLLPNDTLPNVTITFGHFLTHSVPMRVSNSNPTRWSKVDKTEEKGSDVNLAAHILRDGFKGLYELAVVISNDSDLREPVRIVRQDLNLPVGIINPHQRHSKELQEFATFIKRVREADLANSQFPETLNDAKGNFKKPRGW